MLSAEERELLVDQALSLIEHLYVHLPLKRAMHAVDPIQRLRLLKRRSASLSESEFHAELISIFTRLRDLHTNYILPEPLRTRTAYLPFRIEEFFEEDDRQYSTTDIFSAGFQDHGIGKILGTSGATGAGGANVWGHELLLTMLPPEGSPFKPLPKNASFRVAIRRCTRVGQRSGVLVEDLGVVPDAIHRMTKKDVLSGNVDLINQAGEMLATMPVFAVEAKVQNAGAAMRVDATIKNVTRLDVFLNARPFRSLDVVDGATSIDLPQLGAGSNTLELRGFRNGQLVVSTRVDL